MNELPTPSSSGLKEAFAVVREAETFGKEVSENGALMYGHVPHIAPLAWFHIVYPGLDEPALAQLEAKLNRPIPSEYRDLLRTANGLSLFSGSLALYGLRTDYSRRVSIRLPFDLSVPNVKERPRSADPTWFIFGFYDADGSHAYLDPKVGAVFRGTRNLTEPRLNRWASLDDFLFAEAHRLAAQFDGRGHQLDEAVPTTPLPESHAN